MRFKHLPERQGLYDPLYEHENCGVGFVCNIEGTGSHEVIKKGIKVLERMSHRGAVGADPQTGDGAGLLIQLPHAFYKEVCEGEGIDLPGQGQYGTGIIFLPVIEKEREFCRKAIENAAKSEKLSVLGWRDVPVDDSKLGVTARETEPSIKQVFIAAKDDGIEQLDLERRLYVVRKQAEKKIRGSSLEQKSFFYITNISSRTVSYKGLLMPEQVEPYFLDLQDERLVSSLALVHSRYSTNTFPTWDLAQPFRFLAHNGEINTLRGNINWMHARESLLSSGLFGKSLEKIKPVTMEGLSDSATIDNVFELLSLSGRSLEHVMMMLIPGAWEQNREIDPDLLEFYKYHSCLIEPWDGPAAIAFTDGTNIGAVLDRNGLRPARYVVTKSGFVVMASEVGVLDIPAEDIDRSGRLEPGRIFLIDTVKKRIIGDNEIKKDMSAGKPYGKWNREHTVFLEDLETVPGKRSGGEQLITLVKSFGYTREDLKVLLKPMAEEGKEPTGSMGNDTPHAVLSGRPQPLYNYFEQLFAQVTNPAIDPIREEVVMSLESRIGRQGNILEEDPLHARKLRVKRPILTDSQLETIRNINKEGMKTKTIPILFDPASKGSLKKTLEKICLEAEKAINDGYSFIILSDRGVDKNNAAVPALLAVGAVHHHLVRKTLRTGAGIMIESGEPREVFHFACLFGYGADCINPYLAYRTVEYLHAEGQLEEEPVKAVENYRKALEKGILKILSKMGISTLRSYRGAQIFEAIGLSDEVIKDYFTGTASRIGGADISIIEKETVLRHEEAFRETVTGMFHLSSGGRYQWKKDGEFHLWNPESIAALQDAVRTNSYDRYREFCGLIDDQSQNPATLRSLLRLKNPGPVSIDEVEPVSEIFKRFCTGAMSFGSISKGAHESLAIAMNRIGGRSNTGEGGEDPARFRPMENGDSKRSAIKQVASGRFGVTANYLANADELQIKIAQGAKPGEGGQLPGHKVSAVIARTRYTTAGVTLISPPPHHDIYSIEDLAQLIFDLKNVNPRARVSVKLVSEVGVGTIAAGVAKGHADMILISGADGGTGASPKSSIMHAGLPWELGLSETHQTLVLNDLRGRVRLQTDGQMRTARDVAIAAILGAEEYGFCTAALITLGCVMLRHCHLNNCALGVATQDDILQGKFAGRPEYVVNYMTFIAEHLREIMAGLGVRSMDELIGRTDLVEVDTDLIPWKAEGIDYSRILYKPDMPEDIATRCVTAQDHGIDGILDRKLIELAKDTLDEKKPVKEELSISNVNRTTGAMLSGELCYRYGEEEIPDDTVYFKFTGIAGQSFGAFLAKGITFELEGLANDYVGKGISGGKIIIYPDRKATYAPDENILIGNTTFYGAIKGEAYIKGLAGERFCIRNSGLSAVVEGVGDHGCEYMTGGRVVILGKTGRNFAAGMSGGIAYVYDEDGKFSDRCNMEMVGLEPLTEDDTALIGMLIRNHHKYTSSAKAGAILEDFHNARKKFIKVMPVEYKRILETRKLDNALNLTEVSDG